MALLWTCLLAPGNAQEHLPLVIEELTHQDPRVRVEAARALGDVGEVSADAVPALVEALRNDRFVQGHVASALGRIGVPAVPALLEALTDGDTELRAGAARALGEIRAPAAVPGLIAALADSDAAVRGRAASALGAMGEGADDALPALVFALRDTDANVRGEAVSALGAIGEPAVPALIDSLTHADPRVRGGAASALRVVGADAVGAVPALSAALADHDPHVRSEAATSLGAIGESALDAVPALIDTLRDPQAEVRGSAASALGAMGEGAATAVPALVASLRDEDAYVHTQAAVALMNVGDASLRSNLLRLADTLGVGGPPGMTSVTAASLAEFPLFHPWPPPEPSTSKVPLARSFFPGAETLGHVDDQLIGSLEAAGYLDRAHYHVPGGFALVTRLEQINPDGSPKQDGARWVLEAEPPPWFQLGTYLQALFTLELPPGFFRVLVFVVTTEEGFETGGEIGRDEAIAWLEGDWVELPRRVGEQPFTMDHDIVVLVYEFEKPSREEAFLTNPSRHQGRTHLERANGLWRLLQRP